MTAGAAGELIWNPAIPANSANPDAFITITAAFKALIIFHLKLIVLI